MVRFFLYFLVYKFNNSLKLNKFLNKYIIWHFYLKIKYKAIKIFLAKKKIIKILKY